ncbi:MAG TPA: type II toxin-antitoxin system PemK/MazF family toxin [Solirubrobacteraceae bacterium]|nr:type II toxin-antitoxin system PemK/MazF family toxin [Solirubrobacteraceae bacterium]
MWLTAFGAARPGELGKQRPAVVLSVDRMIAGMPYELIVVVPLSSSVPPSALRPEIAGIEGIDRSSSAICRAVRGVARSRLMHRLGELTPAKLVEVERTLALILGLDGENGGSPGPSR